MNTQKSSVKTAAKFSQLSDTERAGHIRVAQIIGSTVIDTLDQQPSQQERGSAIVSACVHGEMKIAAAISAIASLDNGGQASRVVQFVNDNIAMIVASQDNVGKTAAQVKVHRRTLVRNANRWADNGKTGTDHTGGKLGFYLASEIGSAASNYTWQKIVVDSSKPDAGTPPAVPAVPAETKKEISAKIEKAEKAAEIKGAADSKAELTAAIAQIAELSAQLKTSQLAVLAEKESHCRTMALANSYALGSPASAAQVKTISTGYKALAKKTTALAKTLSVAITLPTMITVKSQKLAAAAAKAAANKAAARGVK